MPPRPGFELGARRRAARRRSARARTARAARRRRRRLSSASAVTPAPSAAPASAAATAARPRVSERGGAARPAAPQAAAARRRAALVRDAVEHPLLDGRRRERGSPALRRAQQRRQPGEPGVLGGAVRARGQVRRDGGALLRLQRAEHVGAELLADVAQLTAAPPPSPRARGAASAARTRCGSSRCRAAGRCARRSRAS